MIYFFKLFYIITLLKSEFFLRWLVGLKLIELEQQKTQLRFIILAKNLKPMLCSVINGA